MELAATEKVWNPTPEGEHLTVLPAGYHPPKSMETFLFLQAEMLRRLIQEANDRELLVAQHKLSDQPDAFLLALGPGLRSPRFAEELMQIRTMDDLQEPIDLWRKKAKEILKMNVPLNETKEDRERAMNLTLEPYLDLILR